jgi:hypothetical protein
LADTHSYYRSLWSQDTKAISHIYSKLKFKVKGNRPSYELIERGGVALTLKIFYSGEKFINPVGQESLPSTNLIGCGIFLVGCSLAQIIG